jgi:PAS domain S-box-containing protein
MNPVPGRRTQIDLTTTEDAAFLLDLHGFLSSFNKSFKTFLSCTVAEINDKRLCHFTVASEKELAEEMTSKAINGNASYGHLAFRTNDGAGKIGKITLVPFFEEGQIAGATGFLQDVTATVNANKEIYDHEQRLKAIFYHEPDCVSVISLDGLVVDLNPAGFSLLKGSHEELIGRDFFESVMDADQEKCRVAHQKVCAGADQTLQFRLHSLDVQLHWVEANIVPLRNKQGNIYATLSVIRNISEKKWVEEQLKKQEERIERTKRMARIGYWDYDYDKGQAHSTDSLYDIYGLDRSSYKEITPDLFLSIVHPEDKERVIASLLSITVEHIVEGEHRIIRPDGKVIYVHHSCNTVFDDNGNRVSTSGAVQDITERKEAELALLISEQKFKSLVQNGSDLIVIMDEAGHFTYVSPTARAISGYGPEDLLHKNVFDFIHPDDHELVKGELNSVIGSFNTGKATPHRFLSATGEWMWLESKGVNLIHDSNIRGIIINARNITDRIQLQERLDKELANRQKDITSAVIRAQESERSQLGQELHDNVNQVLTTIKLYNEMLLDRIGNPDDILKKSIHHLQKCINEIRSISKRLSAPTLGKISLSDSINELIDSINLTRKINIRCGIKETNKNPVSQDVHLTVYRIIQEQLNNIIKHAEAKNAVIELMHTPRLVTLMIRDDGKGFDVGMKRTGIGITNIITRAENMNGKVMIESQPGKGCTLKLSFPV